MKCAGTVQIWVSKLSITHDIVGHSKQASTYLLEKECGQDIFSFGHPYAWPKLTQRND